MTVRSDCLRFWIYLNNTPYQTSHKICYVSLSHKWIQSADSAENAVKQAVVRNISRGIKAAGEHVIEFLPTRICTIQDAQILKNNRDMHGTIFV